MDNQNIKILFVEDDEVDQLAFKREVSSRKLLFDIIFASSVSEAKGTLNSNSFDIVIADYNLGDGTALDILELSYKLPLIVITGAGDEQIAINTMKAGAYDYIIKDQARSYLKELPELIENSIRQKKESQQFEMLSTVLMNINDQVSITDLDNNLIFVNDAFLNTYGYKRSEIIGKNIDIVRAENQDKVMLESIIEETMRGGWKGELINKKKDGTKFPIFLSTSVIYDQEGKPSHFFGVSNDITESKKAKEQLAAEKERLSVTLHNIGAGVITTDNKGNINSINKAAEDITGFKEIECKSKPITEVFGYNAQNNKRKNMVAEVIEAGKIVRSIDAQEYCFNDQKKLILENAAPLYDKNNNVSGVVLAFEDVTEKAKMEEELRKTHKLESLGVLAGGIAHDFNNILTSIIGNISLAMMYVKSTDNIYSNLDGALKGCERSRDLTHQLLTFAKGGAPIKENASIVDIVKDSSEFAVRGSGTRCQFNFKEPIWMVEIDIGQISQVINSLVINATQAMPQGGNLHIDIENVTDKNEILMNRFLKENLHYIKLRFRDEGIGIPEKIIQQIFDPYFSTKKKGSGLGLASSYSIIKNHDGYIKVESEVNIGTIFTVYLPADPTKNIKKSSEFTELYKGSENILVMDDEVAIREVTKKMLTSLGYMVSFAVNGEEAIQIYKKAIDSNNPFDVVILDLTIPGGLGGKDALNQLIKMNPNIKAIVSSGYSDDLVMANYLNYGFCERLTKPFDLKTLSEVLNRVINS